MIKKFEFKKNLMNKITAKNNNLKEKGKNQKKNKKKKIHFLLKAMKNQKANNQ